MKINNTLIRFRQWLLSTLVRQQLLSLWPFLSCLVGTLQMIFLGLQLVGATILKSSPDNEEVLLSLIIFGAAYTCQTLESIYWILFRQVVFGTSQSFLPCVLTGWMLIYSERLSSKYMRQYFSVSYCLDNTVFGEFMPPLSFMPLISFGKCVMMWHSLYTYIKWHGIVTGKWISIDSLSIGKHPISSLYQYNKYSQSAFDKWHLWIF